MRNHLAVLLVLLSGPAALAGFCDRLWLTGLWLLATAITIALPHPRKD